MKAKHIIPVVMGLLVLSGCSANLLPKMVKNNPNSAELEAKGKAILQQAWAAHGVNNLLKHEVYELKGTDHWKGMMGGMGKLWPQRTTNLTFRFAPNTFDAQVKLEDGENAGYTAGLQSWNYYETAPGGTANFDVELNKRYEFGMAAFQYFSELVGRLSGAEIIRYAGEKTLNGTDYDLVYATWGQEGPSQEADQYILYINKATHMVEYSTYTVRENYLTMPGSKAFYGTIHLSDYRNIDGYQVPFVQTVFLNEPKKNANKYVHRLTLESFTFDSFDHAELYPNQNIQAIGDTKAGR